MMNIGLMQGKNDGGYNFYKLLVISPYVECLPIYFNTKQPHVSNFSSRKVQSKVQSTLSAVR